LRVTYANVTATLALFIALGGGSYAAVTLPSNSVGTKQLRKNAVTSSKVRDNSLSGADINEQKLARVPSANNSLKLGGRSPSAFQGRITWALVDASGGVIRQSGGVSLVSHDGDGQYTLS